MKKEIYVCDACGCENVEVKAWANINTGKVETTAELPWDEEDCWCPECQMHCIVTTEKRWEEIQDEIFGKETNS